MGNYVFSTDVLLEALRADAVDPGSAGFTGSLVVVEFDSLERAQAWVDDDPYITAGVYRKVTVKPFVPVLP